MKRLSALFLLPVLVFGQELSWPPKLPGGKLVDSGSSPKLLKISSKLRSGVTVAKVAPLVDFLYYPAQDYPGNPWSVWGESLCWGEKYYSSIGDHKGPEGNSFLYEYDAKARKIRVLADLRRVLGLDIPESHP